MNTYQNYLTASFRGIEFILDSGTVNGGRKTVTHEFVNSDRRFVEDLGKKPKIYYINAFVYGKNGSAGFAERDALINALDQKGQGLLVHPDFGNLQVVSKDYDLELSRRTMGRYNFTLTFEVEESDREPFIEPTRGVFGNTIIQQQTLSTAAPVILTENTNLATKSQLASLTEEAREISSNSALGIYTDPTDQSFIDSISEVYTDSIKKIKKVAESIEDDALKATGLTTINKLLADPPSFISNPEVLFPELNSLYNQLSSAAPLKNWIEAGEDFIEIFSFGSEGTERESNVSSTYGALVSNFQINAYLNACDSAATTEFSTVDELEGAELDLDNLYQDVVNNPIDDSVLLNNNFTDLKFTLLEARSTVKNIFTQKEQNIFKISNYDSKNKGIALSTYQLYESMDNLEVVFNLNKNVNAVHPQSNIQIVEEIT